jgi:hypothetical protein
MTAGAHRGLRVSQCQACSQNPHNGIPSQPQGWQRPTVHVPPLKQRKPGLRWYATELGLPTQAWLPGARGHRRFRCATQAAAPEAAGSRRLAAQPPSQSLFCHVTLQARRCPSARKARRCARTVAIAYRLRQRIPRLRRLSPSGCPTSRDTAQAPRKRSARMGTVQQRASRRQWRAWIRA